MNIRIPRVDSRSVSELDFIPVMLLALFAVAVASGTTVVLIARHCQRKLRRELAVVEAPLEWTPDNDSAPVFLQRPVSWLAIRGRNVQAAQAALKLHNPIPCTWREGLISGEKLFIAPPLKGWILIIGWGLPEPDDDVDVCFRFLLEMSRKLGRLQFFHAHRALGHHAWVRAEAGRIVRAYAWAGKTLWNQGAKTSAEQELGMKCFPYFESPEPTVFGQTDLLAANTEKVPLLAEKWSLDPGGIDERLFAHTCGIAGEPSRLY